METLVERFQDSEKDLWDKFVLTSEKSTFFHQIGWKNVIEKSYGLSPYYLIAKKNGEVSGILPLFNVDNRLVSVPFAPYGGLLAQDESTSTLLLNTAVTIIKNENLKYFELRNLEPLNDNFLVSESSRSTFLIGLDCEPEFLWRNTSKSARRLVNKAIQSGITVEMDKCYLKDFYHLYTLLNKEFGSAVHSYDFFNHILHEYPSEATIQVAILDGKVIGAKFLLFHKTTILSAWAATDNNYRKLSPNGLLTWNILQYGCKNNYKVFDFGRSELQTGSVNFKNRWGNPQIRSIYSQYFFNKKQNFQNISKFSIKRKIFSRIWSLVPLTLSVKIGPHLRKHFP